MGSSRARRTMSTPIFSSPEAGDEMSASLIVRDAALLVASAWLVCLKPDRLSLDRVLEKRRRNA
jgi:hypothetical protein